MPELCLRSRGAASCFHGAVVVSRYRGQLATPLIPASAMNRPCGPAHRAGALRRCGYRGLIPAETILEEAPGPSRGRAARGTRAEGAVLPAA